MVAKLDRKRSEFSQKFWDFSFMYIGMKEIMDIFFEVVSKKIKPKSFFLILLKDQKDFEIFTAKSI